MTDHDGVLLAERSVLGALLLHPEAVPEVEFLRPQDFYLHRHQVIAQAIMDLHRSGTPSDPLTVGEELETRGQLETAGGRDTLLDLMESVVSASGVGHHATIVQQHARTRELAQLARELSAQARAGVDLAETVRRAKRRLDALTQGLAGKPTQHGLTLQDVLQQWASEGPIVHQPTGIAALDAATGGGFVLGSRVYIAGAPDAGKTALLVQLLDRFAAQGLTCGLLAVDEEPADVAMRLLQRRGFSRAQCEARHDLPTVGSDGGVLFYDSTFTIEAAAADVARIAKQCGTRCVLGIDSIQTARAHGEADSASRYEAVTSRVEAVRKVASAHRMLTICTSEMSRGAYRNQHGRDAVADMAAAKESGAIEYSARLLLALRSVPREPDLVSLRVAKNKHGRRTPDEDQLGIVLRLDRATQSMTELPDFMATVQGDRESAQAAAAEARAVADAAVVAVVLARQPGLSSRAVRAAARAAAGRMSNDRADVALARLGAAVVQVPAAGRSGGGTAHYLDGTLIDERVVQEVALKDRTCVVAARPPVGQGEPRCAEGVPAHLRGTADEVVCRVPPLGASGHTSPASRFPASSETNPERHTCMGEPSPTGANGLGGTQ